MKKKTIRRKKINKVSKLFNSFKRQKLLDDRSEYDVYDFESGYPDLTNKQAKKLYKKVQLWKYKGKGKFLEKMRKEIRKTK
mgnify:CR=1 FL=1